MIVMCVALVRAAFRLSFMRRVRFHSFGFHVVFLLRIGKCRVTMLVKLKHAQRIQLLQQQMYSHCQCIEQTQTE